MSQTIARSVGLFLRGTRVSVVAAFFPSFYAADATIGAFAAQRRSTNYGSR
jgi:hypothetical protein